MTTQAKNTIALSVLLISGLAFSSSHSANAQELVDLLVERRHRAVANNFIDESGSLPWRSPDLLPVSITLHLTSDDSSSFNSAPELYTLFRIRRIPKLGRGWFNAQFPEVDWVFLGSNELASVDTMLTWRLRGMLESAHGAPTQTLTDFGYWRELTSEQYIQFEYWFVLNNEIPFVVTDTNGPFERGIVVATDKRHAKDITAIRNALFEPLLKSAQMEQYVDYYYDEEFDSWYRTGYDGSDFFVNPIRQSEIGNTRPVLKH